MEKISSPYGERTMYGHTRFHKGIDFDKSGGLLIYATENSTVQSIEREDDGLGLHIRLRPDSNGMIEVLYAHLASRYISVGDRVREGQKIGIMGESGDVTGIHLHFATYKNGQHFDPMIYLTNNDPAEMKKYKHQK